MIPQFSALTITPQMSKKKKKKKKKKNDNHHEIYLSIYIYIYIYFFHSTKKKIGTCFSLCGLDSLFNNISTFVGYSILKPLLEKNNSSTIYPEVCRLRNFLLSLKTNVIARLEFELAYDYIQVQYVSKKQKIPSKKIEYIRFSFI